MEDWYWYLMRMEKMSEVAYNYYNLCEGFPFILL